jgi:general secretion pathway protein E
MNMTDAIAGWCVGPSQIRQARTEAARSGRRFIETLEEQSGAPPADFLQALSAASQIPVWPFNEEASTPAFDLLTFAEAMARECLLLRRSGGELAMVIADPFDYRMQAWAEQHIGQSFSWNLARRDDILAYLARHEQSLRAMEGALNLKQQGDESGKAIEDLSFKTISEDTSAVVKLVHSTLYDALKAEASDIHLETGPSGMVIKYRIDGVISVVGSVNGAQTAEQILSRVKVMSELDIAERRVPQDGRFKVSVNGREVDFRVSIMPSIFGEDAVLRVLDKQTLSDQIKGLRLDNLGFDAVSAAFIRRLAREPHGMLLVTGPTGSGKTTTLYAAISEVNHGRDKILTIEDPVEYQLPGVLQIPVNEKKGLTFARGLRSILRHDPDKIMIGEIRDAETAQIAVQSALTGHLVFSTVHANNVFDVLGRFMHMDVDPYNFVSALNGILAQRLVRVNCEACVIDKAPSAEVLAESFIPADKLHLFHFRAGTGCGACRGSGFRGRKAIAEMLQLDDEMREAIIAREPIRKLKELAKAKGTRFLRETALDLVAQGKSTLEEINRVTFVS